MSTAKVRNVGPKSAAWLRQVGIKTDAEVRAIGSLEAFMKVKRAGFKPSLNLLYALIGAVEDRDWRKVQREQRSTILLRLDDMGLAPR